MSDLQQKLDAYKDKAVAQLEQCGVSDIDDSALTALVNNLKLVIDNNDALLVAGSDESELETVRKNFVVKKLGVDDVEQGKQAVNEVVATMSSIRMKNRAAFYYLLKKKIG